MPTKGQKQQDKIKLVKLIKYIQEYNKFEFEKKEDFYVTAMYNSKTEDHFIFYIAKRAIKKSDEYKYIVSIGSGNTTNNDLWGQQIFLIEFYKGNKDVSKKEIECAKNFYEYVVNQHKEG